MSRFFTLTLFLLASIAFAGDVSVEASPIAVAGRPVSAQLVVAAVPDLQNYCSTEDISIIVRSVGIAHLRALAADVIALKPDFVIQVGDITDNTGGVDQNGTAADADDPTTWLTTPDRYYELTCVKENFFDLLDAAGIPWIAVSGNHDSYRDFEHALPRAAFMAKSYGYAAQNEVNRWHSGYNDTEQRAALFTTGIGPICVVGGDYAIDPAGGTLDSTFISTNIGCGASHPTILLRHYLALAASMGTGNAANSEIFAGVYGHATPTPPGPFLDSSMSALTSGQAVDIFTNAQEVSIACGGVATDGTSMHTGVGWWTVLTVVPSESRLRVEARNPLLGGGSRDTMCGYSFLNESFTFAPTLCTRFPSMVGC